MKYKLVYAACFVVGFMAAPAWRLAPVSRYKNLNEFERKSNGLPNY